MRARQAARNPTRDADGEADLNPERQSRSGALRAVQTVDQATQLGGGLKAKVNRKKRLVARELAYRLGLIALGQVHLDEAGSGTFPEWVCPYRCTGSANGFTPTTSGRQAAGQPFQGM